MVYLDVFVREAIAALRALIALLTSLAVPGSDASESPLRKVNKSAQRSP